MLWSRSRFAGTLAVLALLLTACGSGPATREDLVSALTDQGEMSPASAECVAAAIYDTGDWTQEQLNSASDDPASVPGFQAALDDALDTC